MKQAPHKYEIELEHIGLIKEAKLDVSGLTVIGGKNDTGKSTVGKAVMMAIKICGKYRATNQVATEPYRFVDLLFDGEINDNAYINFLVDNISILSIKTSKSTRKMIEQSLETQLNYAKNMPLDCTFIQTPLVWDLYQFFNSIQNIRTNEEIYNKDDKTFNIKYPYLLWDLYYKIATPKNHKNDTAKFAKHIGKIIGGNFAQAGATYHFFKDNNKIPLSNVASGFKHIGILQALLQNNYVTPQGFFIFDEPENHLHPTWQTRFAEIIVKLVKENIPIMINSHSPYMIESLHKFSKEYKINANFYLADSGKIEKINNSNEATLEEIFHRLNEPFAELEAE